MDRKAKLHELLTAKRLAFLWFCRHKSNGKISMDVARMISREYVTLETQSQMCGPNVVFNVNRHLSLTFELGTSRRDKTHSSAYVIWSTNIVAYDRTLSWRTPFSSMLLQTPSLELALDASVGPKKGSLRLNATPNDTFVQMLRAVDQTCKSKMIEQGVINDGEFFGTVIERGGRTQLLFQIDGHTSSFRRGCVGEQALTRGAKVKLTISTPRMWSLKKNRKTEQAGLRWRVNNLIVTAKAPYHLRTHFYDALERIRDNDIKEV